MLFHICIIKNVSQILKIEQKETKYCPSWLRNSQYTVDVLYLHKSSRHSLSINQSYARIQRSSSINVHDLFGASQ